MFIRQSAEFQTLFYIFTQYLLYDNYLKNTNTKKDFLPQDSQTNMNKP